MKLSTVHARSRLKIGNRFHIDGNGRKGVSLFSQILRNSEQEINNPTGFLRPIQTFLSLAVCTLDEFIFTTLQ